MNQAENKVLAQIAAEDLQLAQNLLLALSAQTSADWLTWQKVVKRKEFLKKNKQFFKKSELAVAYKYFSLEKKSYPFCQDFYEKLLVKPIRTASGVVPVTVLTKPYPCPGHCIFCPNDLRMPKSYLAEEPGAQRAEHNYFDPYLQVYNRLLALAEMGHSTDKVELIVLGGTWTAYPLTYQRWFIQECLQAMNDFPQLDDREKRLKKYQHFEEKINVLLKKTTQQPFLTNDAQLNRQNFAQLQIDGRQMKKNYNQLIQYYYHAPEKAVGLDLWQQATWTSLLKVQKTNEKAKSRCVGLVLETRPDEITPQKIFNLRRLGATKIQLGVQSLNDHILKLNKRGHNVAQTARAFTLLRQAAFKIHIHYMVNLYGATPASEIKDFQKLFSDQRFKPDELKIYPCSLIATAELMSFYQQHLWCPYSEAELLKLSVQMMLATQAYCRITRMIRDIPAQEIVVGNKKSNFRQITMTEIDRQNLTVKEIRQREIRDEKFSAASVKCRVLSYETTVSQEKFIQLVVPVSSHGQKISERLLGFLRLSLPKTVKNEIQQFLPELQASALIRELHIYGRALAIGADNENQAQHFGFGKQLLTKAAQIASKQGFKRLTVISAIGTREYYRQRGFSDGQFYQFKTLET